MYQQNNARMAVEVWKLLYEAISISANTLQMVNHRVWKFYAVALPTGGEMKEALISI